MIEHTADREPHAPRTEAERTDPSAQPSPVHQRSWWNGFAARIMGASAALVLAVVMVTAVISYEALRARALDVTQEALQGQANTLRHDLETRIEHLNNRLRELSNNTLFANALADDVGRDVYLRDFMGDIRMAEDMDVTLAMTDFTGTPIASNASTDRFLPNAGWISQSVTLSTAIGRIVVEDGTPFLLLSQPIIYRNTGTAEGAVVLQVDLSQWLETAFVLRIMNEADWLNALELENAASMEPLGRTTSGRGRLAKDAPKILQHIELPAHVTGVPLALLLSATPAFVEEPLNELLVDVTAFSILVFALALIASYFITRRLTRKLQRLRREAARVSEAKYKDIEFTDEGRDEIDDLARAYSALFEELQRAYRQLEDESAREIEIRERHYKGIVNNSAEGIITIRRDGIVETFNPSAEKIFGYSADEVIGRNVSMLMPTNERAQHDRYLQYSRLHAPRIINRSRELEGMRKSGQKFPLELNVSPMDVGGETRFIGIMRDISERKEFERRINAARIDAEQANLAKSKFLSSMSHELRTPLNAIMGFGQLLEMSNKTPLNASQRQAVDQILKSGEHLLELIDQVLNLAKIESGAVSLDLEPLAMPSMLEDAVSMAATLAQQRGVTIRIDPDAQSPQDGGPFVLADRTRLNQVLLNLLSNAVKYNVPGGTVRVRCEEAPATKGPPRCRVDVIDSGIGIAAPLQGEVFEPFNRLGAEGSDIEGTGIGLTITRELVLMMDGAIGFTSTPGEGSTFWIELPISESDAVARTLTAPDVNAAKADKATGTRRVLYVEDNASNLQLMEMLLAGRDDLALSTAHTAELGIAIAEAEQPDLVLMDINLPGISGLDAVKTLKANPATRDIPVIAVSANAMPNDVEAALNAGFKAYLTKPLDLNKTLLEIDQALGAHQSG